MRHHTKTAIFYQPGKLFKLVINRINHKIARKNIKTNQQLAVFAFDHIGLIINLDGRYEDLILCLLEQFILKNFPEAGEQAALDIGANVGNHSVFLSKFFKTVHAFEPNPFTYDVLSVNSKYVPPKKNVVPHNIGLSDSVIDLPFITYPLNMGGSKIIHQKQGIDTSSETQIKVKVERGDDLKFLRQERIALIKIDVEGHEILALKGLEQIIKLHKPAILFEQGMHEINSGSSEVISYLLRLGYEFYTIKKRFYLGESSLAKLLRYILISIFGDQLSFIKTKSFKKINYELILGISS